PVSILGLLVAFGFEAYYWNVQAEPLYRGMVIFDHFSLSFSMLCIALTILILLLSKEYFKSISDNIAEYYSLILFSLTGAILVCYLLNFIMMRTGIGIRWVILYTLGVIRRTDEACNEDLLDYWLIGRCSSDFFLFVITILDGKSGPFALEVMKEHIIDSPTV